VSACVAVTLDTTAPGVVLGTPTHAIAGQVITIPYTADEPLDSAELILPDAREVTLTVTPTPVYGLIPADCVQGPAVVRVRDDLANEASYPGLTINGIVVSVTLDTTAPSVVFGNSSGANAGGFLQIAYVSDEPIARAVMSIGARQLLMSVLADRLTADVPIDWPAGFVAITVEDDLANDRRYDHVVEIESEAAAVASPAPFSASVGLGSTIPHRVDRLFWEVVVRVSERTATTTRVGARARQDARSAAATRSAVAAVLHLDQATLAQSTNTVAAASTTSVAVTSSVAARVRHRDGAEIEALLLDLL
jgi:hypothetical protein